MANVLHGSAHTTPVLEPTAMAFLIDTKLATILEARRI